MTDPHHNRSARHTATHLMKIFRWLELIKNCINLSSVFTITLTKPKESFNITCDQASLLFLSGWERNAWYNYLTIRLLLVHNLDFSLIGQQTKGYLELSHDWLPVWQCDFRSKKIPRADKFDHGVWRGDRRERVFVSFKCFSCAFCSQNS